MSLVCLGSLTIWSTKCYTRIFHHSKHQHLALPSPNIKIFGKHTSLIRSREVLLKGRLSTVDLYVLTSLDQLLFK
jgi:hypothetical protein